MAQDASPSRLPIAEHSPAANRRTDVAPSGLFAALLAKLPGDILASLSDTQLQSIANALNATKAQHLIEYRASLPFMGYRYYLTVFFGPERRNLTRLKEEGQTDIHVVTYAYLAIMLILLGGMTMSLVFLFYLVKAAIGIDFFDGPSSFHEIFFPQT